jgi:hypothetical protein
MKVLDLCTCRSPDRPRGPPNTMDTGSFPGVRCGRGVRLTPHPLPVPRSKIEYSYTSTLPKGLRGLWNVETYTCQIYGGFKIFQKSLYFWEIQKIQSFKLHFFSNNPLKQLYTSASRCKGVACISRSHFVKPFFSSSVAFLMMSLA